MKGMASYDAGMGVPAGSDQNDRPGEGHSVDIKGSLVIQII